MRNATIVSISVSLLAAGCIGTGGDEEEDNADTPGPEELAGTGATGPAGPPAASGEPPGALRRTVANWTGHIRVGAFGELPDHVAETRPATESLWSTSFHYEVVDVPQELEIRLDWTAVSGQILFMVVLPDENATMYETPAAPQGPLCGKIPADQLVPGRYAIMAHSDTAVDARLSFSVATLGGTGRIVDDPHVVPAAEVAGFLAEAAIAGGDLGDLPPFEPCEGA